MGSQLSKDRHGGKHSEAPQRSVSSFFQPDQLEVLKVSWKAFAIDGGSKAGFPTFYRIISPTPELIPFVERLFLAFCYAGLEDPPKRQLQSITWSAKTPTSPQPGNPEPHREETFTFQQFVSVLEKTHRSSPTNEQMGFLAYLYRDDQTNMLGRPELARMFTDLTSLISFVSDYEMSAFIPAGAAPASPKLDEGPVGQPRDANTSFDIPEENVDKKDSTQSTETPKAGITMSKLNIQIPTVKGGVSVNPMNESRMTPDQPKQLSEEEIQKQLLEQDLRVTRRLIRGMMQSLFDHSSRKTASPTDGTTEPTQSVSVSDFVAWACELVPRLAHPLYTFVQLKFFTLPLTDAEKKTYKPIAMVPIGIDMAKSSLWGYGIRWALDLTFDDKKPLWKLLYHSGAHGHSINRFIHHTVGYDGPTLMFIRTTEGSLFGAYVSTPWQVSSKFFGDTNCFLFALDPKFTTKRPQGPEKNYVYLFDKKNTHSGFPVGIGFGGTTSAFRIMLSDDLSSGHARQLDSSYESGQIIPQLSFEVDLIEVWGCGGDAAEMALARNVYVREKQSERARKVNRAQAASGWMNGPDKFIMDLLGKTGSSDAYHDEIKAARKKMKEASQHNTPSI